MKGIRNWKTIASDIGLLSHILGTFGLSTRRLVIVVSYQMLYQDVD